MTISRAAVPLLVVVALACGGAAATPAAASVQAADFSFTLSTDTLPAGDVTFTVNNAGPSVHEFVIISTDTPAGQLPTEAGEVEEDGLDVVDEIEDIDPGQSPTLNINLPAGHYALICNVSGHYAAGMYADINVQ